ncbi:MAG: cytochrome c [Candidatus Acidiferrales bacterium]
MALGLAAILLAYAGTTRPVGADAKPTKTTQDGVYTEDQAKQGKAQYSQSCASCHMDDLSGSGQALPLVGDAFTQTWEGQTVDDLFELIRTTMPQDKPGNLTPEQTLNVVAFLLQSNQFPAGKDELKSDPDALKNILITTKKSGN